VTVGEAADLAALDARQHRRLVALARHATADRDTLGVQDLAFILHDVLVDGFRRDREVKARHEQAWAKVEPVARGALERPVFDQQLFLVGAYASVVGVELALAEPERSAVVEEFLATSKGALRLRRSRPGRWQVERAIRRYREAAPEEGGSYLHVARVFTGECGGVVVGAPDVEGPAAVLGEVGLTAFYEHAAGTVNAATTWRIVVP